MNNMRKIFAMVLAVMLVMSLATTAFAAEGDIYEIYQVFTGTYSDGVLSDVKWGVNGKNYSAEEDADLTVSSDILEALTAVNSLSDKEKLAVIEQYVDLDTDPYKTGKTTSYEGLPNGYYLVKNVDGSQSGENQFYTMYVVNVVDGTLSFSPKGSVPTVDKDVDVTDVSIGDTVTFTLTATMPSNIADYDSYKVIFHDTMSKGLTYGRITSVKVGETTLTADQYTVGTEAVKDKDGNATGETALTVTIADVTDYNVTKDSTVVVTYTATLDADAVIGTEGNPNTVYLEYSNNPNTDGEGDTGVTPPDTVKVYTWSLKVIKVDGNGAALPGAGFTLYDEEGNEIKLTQVGETNTYKVDPNGEVSEVITDSTGIFIIEGLESATYTLKETTTPAGYNTAPDTEVTINGTTTAVAEVTVTNYAGSTLPETGGIGTTLFYIIGGVMVLAAVVLLVTKKRMSVAE